MKDLARYGLPWVVLIVLFYSIRLLDTNLNSYLYPWIFGLIIIYYFRIDNPHSSYKNSVTLALLAWILSFQMNNQFGIGTWLPAIAAGVLAYLYYLRLKNRVDRQWVDFLKLFGVLLLVPATYFKASLIFLIMVFLGFIYVLDRLIIRKQMNKLTQIITFCGLTLICLSFMIYSFIKADEAEKLRIEAEAQRLHAAEFSSTLQNSINEITIELKRQEAINLELREAIDLCNSNK